MGQELSIAEEMVARSAAYAAMYGSQKEHFAGWPVPDLREFTEEVAQVVCTLLSVEVPQ